MQMLAMSSVGLVLILLVTGGMVAPAPMAGDLVAPVGYSAPDLGEMAELDAAAAQMSEAELVAARGEIGRNDEFPWEYILIFAVIAGAMAATIAIT